MAVRNFWIDGDIDGRATELSGGPRSKDGGMYVSIKQRKQGNIMTALRINCDAAADGTLETTIRDGSGKLIFKYTTER